MSKYYKIILANFIFFFLYFLFFIPQVNAAQLFFEPETQELGINQEFQLTLLLDSQDQEINTVAGTVVFPGDLLEVIEIRDGNSILTLWVEKPVLQEGKITFAGVIPGGFSSLISLDEEMQAGEILEIIFKAKKPGQSQVSVEQAEALLHDGEGTGAELSTLNFNFSIKETVEFVPLVPPQDIIPPESFTIEVAQHPEMFDNEYFLVFSATDKQSGMAHYAVHESVRKKTQIPAEEWTKVPGSPHLLTDQELRSYIYVKAIDRAGNETIEILEPPYPIKWYEDGMVYVIILLIIVVLIVLRLLRKTKAK